MKNEKNETRKMFNELKRQRDNKKLHIPFKNITRMGLVVFTPIVTFLVAQNPSTYSISMFGVIILFVYLYNDIILKPAAYKLGLIEGQLMVFEYFKKEIENGG